MMLSAAEHQDQTFEGLDAKGAALAGKHFEGCTFLDCHLAEADFQHARLLHCTFKRCDLSNAKFKGATLRELVCEDSKLLGLDFSRATAASHLHLVNCVLSYANFAQHDLRKAKLDGSIFREADFGGANLSQASCVGADFSGARFASTNLSKADLRQARGYAIDPASCNVKGMRASMPEALSILAVLGVVVG